MTDNNDILMKNCLIKANRSLETSRFLIENSDVDAAFNRIYYSIFYAVMALGYKDGFITSKHRQLMGWFNKIFVNEKKIFSNKMYQIHKAAYDNRQDSDYNLIIISEKTLQEAEASLKDAEIFIHKISHFLK